MVYSYPQYSYSLFFFSLTFLLSTTSPACKATHTTHVVPILPTHTHPNLPAWPSPFTGQVKIFRGHTLQCTSVIGLLVVAPQDHTCSDAVPCACPCLCPCLGSLAAACWLCPLPVMAPQHHPWPDTLTSPLPCCNTLTLPLSRISVATATSRWFWKISDRKSNKIVTNMKIKIRME